MTDDERFRAAVPYLLLGVFGFAVTLFTLLGMFAPALFVAIFCGVVGAIGFAVYAQELRLEIRIRHREKEVDDRASASQRVVPDRVVVRVEREIVEEVKQATADGWGIQPGEL